MIRVKIKKHCSECNTFLVLFFIHFVFFIIFFGDHSAYLRIIESFFDSCGNDKIQNNKRYDINDQSHKNFHGCTSSIYVNMELVPLYSFLVFPARIDGNYLFYVIEDYHLKIKTNKNRGMRASPNFVNTGIELPLLP